MGTDIHIQIEGYINDDWHDINKEALPYRGMLDELWTNPDKYTAEEKQKRIMEYWEENPEGRNYRLFAFLADIRNGYGFAGVKTFEPIVPIVEHRGIPEDTCFEDQFDEAIEWCHSFTHFTMKELLEADGWRQEISNSGCVPIQAWKEFLLSQETSDPLISPSTYCGEVSGDNVKKITMQDFVENYQLHESSNYPSLEQGVVNNGSFSDMVVNRSPSRNELGKKIYVKGKWTEKNSLLDTGFWEWLNGNTMSGLAEKYGADNIRINVYFDN